MTENEAIEKFKRNIEMPFGSNISKEASEMAILALSAEFREALEKQKPKTPHIWGDGNDDEGDVIYDMYDCPNCGETYELYYTDYDYCPKCGQRLDKTDLE